MHATSRPSIQITKVTGGYLDGSVPGFPPGKWMDWSADRTGPGRSLSLDISSRSLRSFHLKRGFVVVALLLFYRRWLMGAGSQSAAIKYLEHLPEGRPSKQASMAY